MDVLNRWMWLLVVAILTSEARADVSVSQVWRDPQTGALYALPTNDDSAGRPPTIHISDDWGDAWKRLPGIPAGAGGELAITTFSVIPSTPGAVILFAGTESDGLYRSIDGGATWNAWNDAPVGIREISVADQPGETSWTVAVDGAVYVSLDDGDNWTLVSEIAGKTVTAIANSGGDTAWVGTEAGELIELASAGSVVTVLSGSAPFDGRVTLIARTDDGTLYVAVDEGDPDGSQLYRTDAEDLLTFAEILRDGERMQVRRLAAAGDGLHILEHRENAVAVGPGEVLEYLVTHDKGESFADQALSPMIANQVYAGSCDGCDPWVLVAHSEGIYLKAREGLGWNVLSSVEEPVAPPPPPPPPATAHSDLSVRMVSPAQNSTRIARSTRRFELSVSNNGPDAVSDVLVEVQFSAWVDRGAISIKPTQSWGDSATIAGQDCERGHDSYADEMLLCRMDSLASGDTAAIVLVQPLSDMTVKLRIDAEVSANYHDDPNGNNDWVVYEPSVEENPPNSGRSGTESGGGGVGILMLLALLAGSFRRAIGAIDPAPIRERRRNRQ